MTTDKIEKTDTGKRCRKCGADLVVGVMRTCSNADYLLDDQQWPPGAHLERVKELVVETPIAVPFGRQVTSSNAEHAQQVQ